MATLAEIEAQVMDLTDSERAILASHILRSLPTLDDYDEEGIAEALRRDAEMDADPSMCITFDELKRSVGR